MLAYFSTFIVYLKKNTNRQCANLVSYFFSGLKCVKSPNQSPFSNYREYAVRCALTNQPVERGKQQKSKDYVWSKECCVIKAEFCKKKLHRAQRQGQRKRRRLSFGCASQGSSFADTNQIGWRTRKLQCWRGRARWRFPRADSFQNTPHLFQSTSTSSTSLCSLASSVKMNQHHLCGRSSVCGVQLHCVECPALWIDGFANFEYISVLVTPQQHIAAAEHRQSMKYALFGFCWFH